MATGWGDSMLRLHTPDGQRRAALTGHTPGCWIGAATFVDDTLLTGGTDGSVLRWELGTPSLGASLFGPGLPIWDIAVQPGTGADPQIALGCRDGVLRLIGDGTTDELGKLGESVNTVGFLPGTSHLAWFGDGDVGVYDLASRQAAGRRRGPWSAMATPDATTPQPLYVADADGRIVSLTSPELLMGDVVALEGHVTALTAAGGVAPVLVAGTRAGRVYVVPLTASPVADELRARYSPVSRVDPSALALQTEFQADEETAHDRLDRSELAKAVANRLCKHNEREREPMVLLVDGKWGTGKSSLLRMIEVELTSGEKSDPPVPPWTVVRYNAWQQASTGQPRYTLLAAMRRAVYGRMGRFRRVSTKARELWFTRVARTPALITLLLALCVAIGIALAVRPNDVSSIFDLLQAGVAVLGAIGALLAILGTASTFLTSGSRRGAKFVEAASDNPAEQITANVCWLLCHQQAPTVLVVDDLDRCDRATLVEVLETIQTIFRVAAQEASLRRGDHAQIARRALYALCGADRVWIARSFEAQFEEFQAQFGSPGRSLGYLFCDKIFQAIVPMPVLDELRRRKFLAGLLSPAAAAAADDHQELRRRIERSSTEGEVLDALTAATPAARAAVAGVALDRITNAELQAATEHALLEFTPLLPANPRSIKRFVNDYTMARAARTMEGSFASMDALARWVILNSRWPGLCLSLAEDPELVEGALSPETPEEIMLLLGTREVRHVTMFGGKPLTADVVRQCCGAAAAAASPAMTL